MYMSFKRKIRSICLCAKSKYNKLDSKLTQKMIELRRSGALASASASSPKKFTTINSIIIKFPKLRQDVSLLTSVFHKYDEDHNGAINREELDKCLQELQVNLTKQDMDDLFHSCDFHPTSAGIQLVDFIILLCLLHLLAKPSCSTNANSLSRLGSPQLEATLDTIVEAFFFMDKNGDGKFDKKDLVMALTEGPWERSPYHVTSARFREMDRDKDGHVTFREFISTLISWLGIDIEDEIIPITSD